jgi:hypothetical protein
VQGGWPGDGNIDIETAMEIVVSDVLRGMNIEQEYPGFWQKLQNDAELRQEYEDAIRHLQGDTVPLPFPANKNLSFLAADGPVNQ